MNTLNVLDAAIEHPPAGPDAPDRRPGLLSILREASSTIDGMWRSALQEGPTETAHRLGEASHAVHLALIALAPS